MSAAPVVLEARSLVRHYRVGGGLFREGAVLRAVAGVSFALARGRTLAIVGESGCGKSTLARMVTMIEEPTARQSHHRWRRRSTTASAHAERRRLRSAVQIVFQDPYGSLNPRQKVQTILAEPLRINTTLSAAERREAVADIMRRVGLRPEYAPRYPAHVLGRPAAAYRGCPSADAQAQDRRPRRARVGA